MDTLLLVERKLIEENVLGYYGRQKGWFYLDKNQRGTKFITPSPKSCKYNMLSEKIHNSDFNKKRDYIEWDLFNFLEKEFSKKELIKYYDLTINTWNMSGEWVNLKFIKHWLDNNANIDSFRRFDSILNFIKYSEYLKLSKRDRETLYKELNIIKHYVYEMDNSKRSKTLLAKENKIRRSVCKNLKNEIIEEVVLPDWLEEAKNKQFQFQKINEIVYVIEYKKELFNDKQLKFINKQLNKWDYESSKMHYKIPQQVKNGSRRIENKK